jgi:hypothetical protein
VTVHPLEPAYDPTRGYLGRVGQRITVAGTVAVALWLKPLDSMPSRLLIVDTGSAIAKTVTAAGWAADVHAGDQLTITGTVKKYEQWHGTPQTVLVRPRQVDPTTAVAAVPHWETVRDAGPRRRFQDTPITRVTRLAPRLTT